MELLTTACYRFENTDRNKCLPRLTQKQYLGIRDEGVERSLIRNYNNKLNAAFTNALHAYIF